MARPPAKTSADNRQDADNQANSGDPNDKPWCFGLLRGTG
jgi:hypothetical protein